MADSKITALTALTAADPVNDMFPVVDVSDTTMAASGTTKKISVNNILGASGTATLASATITGDLTVDTSTLKVDSTNNRVGIGTATPGETLHVSGGSSDGVIKVSNTSSGNGYLIARTTGELDVFNAANASIRFSTNGTLQATLNSTGLGVGVTPSAWGTNSKVVQVSGGSAAVSSTGAGSTASRFTHGCYFDNTNWKYQNTSVGPALYEVTGANAGSTHAWSVAPGGTAGNNITFTQAMTLDASGNLLVGLTSNPNTARAYFRYDTLTTQPVINSASIVAAGTGWNHFIGQSGNGSSVTTNNIFIRGNGNVENANGVYGTISDLRLKENISDARNYLADLLKLRVVKYSLKSEESAVATKIGFIAQEVEQVFPSLITTDTDDNKSIKTSVLIPMLLKAIQELTARVQTLEAR